MTRLEQGAPAFCFINWKQRIWEMVGPMVHGLDHSILWVMVGSIILIWVGSPSPEGILLPGSGCRMPMVGTGRANSHIPFYIGRHPVTGFITMPSMMLFTIMEEVPVGL
jgi:hypothetical protein